VTAKMVILQFLHHVTKVGSNISEEVLPPSEG